MLSFSQLRPMTVAWAIVGGLAGAWFFESIFAIVGGVLFGLAFGLVLDRAHRPHPQSR